MTPHMIKKRNAQGLSITAIVVAVIALIVIVVLIAVFSGRMGDFRTGLTGAGSCAAVCNAAGFGGSTGTIAHPGLVDADGTPCTCDT